MGVQTIDSGDGYALYDKGDNAHIKLSTLDVNMEEQEYKGDTYYDMEMVFDSKAVAGDTEGQLPFWPTSKITLAETDEMTSNMAKLLRAAEILEDVLNEIIDDEEAVQQILDGDAKYEAESGEENQELGKAIAKHLKNKVLKAGTKQNKSGEYSLVDAAHSLADSNPFEGDAETADESEDDDEDEIFVDDEDEE